MHIEPNNIHIWFARLSLTANQEAAQFTSLDDKERERALRFRFPIHRARFIAAHYFLREVLAFYLKIDLSTITFDYNEHNKPFISSNNPQQLQFNLSHSEDVALCAVTLNHPIGVDIEKIQGTARTDVAERFFSTAESAKLAAMSEEEAIQGFFRIWSRKEAVIKAIGKGLSIPLSAFSVAPTDTPETIFLEGQEWSLLPLPHYPNYTAAVASAQSIAKLSCWDIYDHAPVLMKDYTV